MFVMAISHDTTDVVSVSGDVFLKRLAVGIRGKIDFRRNAVVGTTSARAFGSACRGFSATHGTPFFARGCS